MQKKRGVGKTEKGKEGGGWDKKKKLVHVEQDGERGKESFWKGIMEPFEVPKSKQRIFVIR